MEDLKLTNGGKGCKKVFILDTNVLIHDPSCIFKFEENDIIIDITLIEELDQLKKQERSVGYAAREAIRQLSKLDLAKIKDGAELPGGGRLTVVINEGTVFHHNTPDNRILYTAQQFKNRGCKEPVIVVSKDANVRLKSELLGIHAQDYKADKTSLFKNYGRVLGPGDETDGVKSVRYILENDTLYRLQGDKKEPARKVRDVYGLKPANLEQECALDALLNPRVTVTCLTGKAGTGKTLISIAAALYCMDKYPDRYEQLLITRPVIPIGSDLGFLPGDVNEKLRPWFEPIRDNLEFLMSSPSGDKPAGQKSPKRKATADSLIKSGLIQIEPLTYLRGRSLPHRFYIIDEAQNLTPREIKTILTRAGEGTRVVLTGDLEQIDNHYLDSESNGLSYLISRFINEPDFCYLNFTRTSRSSLAERAAELL